MDLDRYVADLRTQLAAVAEAGDDEARALAERFSIALEPAARMVLLEALSDAAGEISREIAPGSVDVRLRGRDPELVVTPAPTPEYVAVPSVEPVAADAEPAADLLDDAVTSRTTLRLPDRLKAKVEQAAAEDGVSVNSWLVRTIADAVDPGRRRPEPHTTRTGDSFTGWFR